MISILIKNVKKLMRYLLDHLQINWRWCKNELFAGSPIILAQLQTRMCLFQVYEIYYKNIFSFISKDEFT